MVNKQQSIATKQEYGQMMRTIELNYEQVDSIVKEELLEAYKENLKETYSDEILDALEIVLQYYMSPSEYFEWFPNRGRNDGESEETL
jgi:Tfp pilus assembly PilM family ATPase